MRGANSCAAIETEGVANAVEGKWTCDDGIESMDSKVTIGVDSVYKKILSQGKVTGTSDEVPFQGLVHVPAVSGRLQQSTVGQPFEFGCVHTASRRKSTSKEWRRWRHRIRRWS